MPKDAAALLDLSQTNVNIMAQSTIQSNITIFVNPTQIQ
jgi:hypothetical protein